MAAIQGMDPDDVDRLGDMMKRHAESLKGLVSEITSTLSGTTWMGNDRNKFDSEWQSHAANLNNLAGWLDGAGTSAKNNATEQRDVSNR